MTTYRIRPLKWEPREERDVAEITRDIYYVAYPNGACYAMFFDSMDRATDRESARAACESHWRGVLEAALEPVAILPTLQRLREHLVLMMQYGYDDGELATLDGLIALITPTP